MKIALTGPESTGKTETALYLSEKFKAAYVPEMARNYIDNLNRPYNESDLLEIARLQCLEEDKAAAENNIVICDTTLQVVKIWSEYRYGQCHPWILNEYNKRLYELYLLCNTDVAWTWDKQRENKDDREKLFHLYHKDLSMSGMNYEILTGQGETRYKRAEFYISRMLKNPDLSYEF